MREGRERKGEGRKREGESWRWFWVSLGWSRYTGNERVRERGYGRLGEAGMNWESWGQFGVSLEWSGYIRNEIE